MVQYGTTSQGGPNKGAEVAEAREKIDALAEIADRRHYQMGSRMSSRVYELALNLPEGDPDKEEAFAAIHEMLEALLHLKEQDNTIQQKVEGEKGIKPSKIKREARKERFKMIMPGGRVDAAFTRLFAIYKKNDDKLNGNFEQMA
ncbi:hypothetical protein HOG48_01960 [Candidatus Peregrinibacteria bacterium]|jgi:hypothetical protein|nr:hypothetical protein [Candidatus Peregrinibacteria bacterium]